jgi:hypothetical protein
MVAKKTEQVKIYVPEDCFDYETGSIECTYKSLKEYEVTQFSSLTQDDNSPERLDFEPEVLLEFTLTRKLKSKVPEIEFEEVN